MAEVAVRMLCKYVVCVIPQFRIIQVAACFKDGVKVRLNHDEPHDHFQIVHDHSNAFINFIYKMRNWNHFTK